MNVFPPMYSYPNGDLPSSLSGLSHLPPSIFQDAHKTRPAASPRLSSLFPLCMYTQASGQPCPRNPGGAGTPMGPEYQSARVLPMSRLRHSGQKRSPILGKATAWRERRVIAVSPTSPNRPGDCHSHTCSFALRVTDHQLLFKGYRSQQFHRVTTAFIPLLQDKCFSPADVAQLQFFFLPPLQRSWISSARNWVPIGWLFGIVHIHAVSEKSGTY